MSMNLEKLREEIADLMCDRLLSAGCHVTLGECETLTTELLEHPSIATALRFTDLHRSAGVVVGDPKISSPE